VEDLAHKLWTGYVNINVNSFHSSCSLSHVKWDILSFFCVALMCEVLYRQETSVALVQHKVVQSDVNGKKGCNN